MTLPVGLGAVIDEMDVAGDEMTAFINRSTGELITLSQEDISYTERCRSSGFADSSRPTGKSDSVSA